MENNFESIYELGDRVDIAIKTISFGCWVFCVAKGFPFHKVDKFHNKNESFSERLHKT